VKKGLLEAMLPQSVVPSRVAVSLLMWACSLKSSVKLKVSYVYDCFYTTAACCGGVRCKCDVISLLFFQGLVLRWILLVVDMLDSRQELSAVYFMIFHMLRNESMVRCLLMTSVRLVFELLCSFAMVHCMSLGVQRMPAVEHNNEKV
jgi:hypothetical protein